MRAGVSYVPTVRDGSPVNDGPYSSNNNSFFLFVTVFFDILLHFCYWSLYLYFYVFFINSLVLVI